MLVIEVFSPYDLVRTFPLSSYIYDDERIDLPLNKMFSDFAFSSSSEIGVTEYATMPPLPEYVVELSCDDKV